jgi:hypothetical protein
MLLLIMFDNYDFALIRSKECPMGTMCPICLRPMVHENSNFKQTRYVKKMLCLHTFHIKCINNWLQIKRNCPCCRSKLLFITRADLKYDSLFGVKCNDGQVDDDEPYAKRQRV